MALHPTMEWLDAPARAVCTARRNTANLGIHSLNWASMLLDLAQATGDDAMRQRAIQTGGG